MHSFHSNECCLRELVSLRQQWNMVLVPILSSIKWVPCSESGWRGHCATPGLPSSKMTGEGTSFHSWVTWVPLLRLQPSIFPWEASALTTSPWETSELISYEKLAQQLLRCIDSLFCGAYWIMWWPPPPPGAGEYQCQAYKQSVTQV